MFQPEKSLHCRAVALVALLSLIQLTLNVQRIDHGTEVGRWFLLSEDSSAVARSIINPHPRVTIRATLVHWYGPVNYKAMEAWVKYHGERWGVTHVDIFLPDRRLNEARGIFGEMFNGVNVSIYSNLIREEIARRDVMFRRSLHVLLLFTQALDRSQMESNDFLMNFDADEFLVSDDFKTLAELFAHTDNHSAVSIPVYNNDYRRCSSNSLTFGSATFNRLRPINSDYVDDAKLEYYSEPPRACKGNSKYIVIPKFFHELRSPHNPHGCLGHEETTRPPSSNTTYYMTGRKTDREHVRVVHMRTSLGLFADMTMAGCTVLPACKHLNIAGNCTRNLREAVYINEPNSVNMILQDFPLFTGAAEFSAHAVCYAQRYPSLLQQYCEGGNINQCLFGALGQHYEEEGKVQNLTWGCVEQFPSHSGI